MTDAEHVALSAQLALALGWKPIVAGNAATVSVRVPMDRRGYFYQVRRFDYRDPTVYGPLIEFFGSHSLLDWWHSDTCGWRWAARSEFDGCCDTLPEAVARAVIAVKGQK